MSNTDDNDSIEEIMPKPMPLVSLDDAAPLLLDLPDGQQLVLGRLPDGVVIEIATWRGTGRPDSRTNRIMLGVSFDEEIENEANSTSKNFIANRFKRSKSTSENDSSAMIEVTEVQTPPETYGHESVVEATSTSALPSNVDPEPVQITQRFSPQDIMGARSRAQMDTDSNRDSIINPDRGYEIVKRGPFMANRKAISYLLGALKVMVPIAAVLALLIFSGVKIVHPQAGLKTSLSSANGALIVVKDSSAYKVGDNVVADVEGDQPTPIFAAVAALSEGDYILTANNLYFTAPADKVNGKVLLVIPGLGYVAGIFD